MISNIIKIMRDKKLVKFLEDIIILKINAKIHFFNFSFEIGILTHILDVRRMLEDEYEIWKDIFT